MKSIKIYWNIATFRIKDITGTKGTSLIDLGLPFHCLSEYHILRLSSETLQGAYSNAEMFNRCAVWSIHQSSCLNNNFQLQQFFTKSGCFSTLQVDFKFSFKIGSSKKPCTHCRTNTV